MKRNIVLNGDDDKLSTVKEYNGMQPDFSETEKMLLLPVKNVEKPWPEGNEL